MLRAGKARGGNERDNRGAIITLVQVGDRVSDARWRSNCYSLSSPVPPAVRAKSLQGQVIAINPADDDKPIRGGGDLRASLKLRPAPDLPPLYAPNLHCLWCDLHHWNRDALPWIAAIEKGK